jgi:hypothetical protein
MTADWRRPARVGKPGSWSSKAFTAPPKIPPARPTWPSARRAATTPAVLPETYGYRRISFATALTALYLATSDAYAPPRLALADPMVHRPRTFAAVAPAASRSGPASSRVVCRQSSPHRARSHCPPSPNEPMACLQQQGSLALLFSANLNFVSARTFGRMHPPL